MNVVSILMFVISTLGISIYKNKENFDFYVDCTINKKTDNFAVVIFKICVVEYSTKYMN